jgi:Cu(I)/Ag(I) efflux system protein CusF
MKFLLAAGAALILAAPALAQEPYPGAAAGHEQSAAATVEGVGVIKGVDPKAGTITLHHGPIAALQWPAMTMTFKASAEVLKTAKSGQTVKFTLQPGTNEVIAIQAS